MEVVAILLIILVIVLLQIKLNVLLKNKIFKRITCKFYYSTIITHFQNITIYSFV